MQIIGNEYKMKALGESVYKGYVISYVSPRHMAGILPHLPDALGSGISKLVKKKGP